MDAVEHVPTLYLILYSAAAGAGLASVSIALYASRNAAWDWLYATALRKIRNDSLKTSRSESSVRELRPKR